MSVSTGMDGMGNPIEETLGTARRRRTRLTGRRVSRTTEESRRVIRGA